jgi:hypothetical protein
MESYANFLQGLYSAMLVDIAHECPHLHADSVRDTKRMLSIVEKVGVRFFLIDLPAMGKHFDLCLSQSRLTPYELPFTRPFRRCGVIPRLFKGLHLLVFNEDGELRLDADTRAVRYLRQLFLSAKRFRMTCDDPTTWKQVAEFFRIDLECPSPSLSWDEDSIEVSEAYSLDFYPRSTPKPSNGDLFEETARPISSVPTGVLQSIHMVADLVSGGLGWFDPVEWRSKHGPGAVSDTRRGTSKYLFPNWPDKLEHVFPLADCGFHNYTEWADWCSAGGDSCFSKHEPPSRLIAVPKTLSAPRLIASEPTSHQWCQQTLLDFLVTRVKDTDIGCCINFKQQSVNGALALEASRTQSHATIDLSSASDRLSCWLIERIFRRNARLLQSLHACRTRYICNEIDKKSPKFHKLRKFSTMGSAITFPVQSIVFSIIATAVVHYVRGRKFTKKEVQMSAQEVRVYGDDIIVPVDCWPLVQGALVHLGLEVNRNKTFGTGKFRESCGVDAYNGEDVSRVSILTIPDVSRPGSIASLVDVHNNFLLKGYDATASFVKLTVAGIKQLRIPDVPIGSGTFGFYSFKGFDGNFFSRKYNHQLQRVEYLCTVLRSAGSRRDTEGRAMVLQYFTEVCKPPLSSEDRLGVPSQPATKLSRRWVTEDLLA